ncbi:energy transducer TonB [Pseudidiomarina insulisalsae]|nr:energy transducer TonB [Pseudidiomarina insulisalsae]
MLQFPGKLRTLLIASAISSACLSQSTVALPFSQNQDAQAFEHAYGLFQEAQANADTPQSELKKLALQAFESGRAYFGDEHFNTATLAINYLLLLSPDERKGSAPHAVAVRAVEVYQNELPASDMQQLEPLLLALETMPEANATQIASYESALEEVFSAWPDEKAPIKLSLRVRVAEELLRLEQSRPTLWERLYQESSKLLGESHPLTFKTGFFSSLQSASPVDAVARLEQLTQADAKNQPEAKRLQLAANYRLATVYGAQKKRDKVKETLTRVEQLQTELSGESPSQLLTRVSPSYPRENLNTTEGGKVLLMFDVDAEGRTQNISIISATDRHFAKAARDALAQWVYIPAYQEGKPVVSKEQQVQLDFSLQRSG